MKAFVGVTDLAWYAQLQAASSDHDEVNFWFPSARQGFSAFSTGEFFIFKTHVDRRQPDLSNRIVGVGIFSGYARLRVSEAWKWFGLGNGTGSLSELKSRIERYRRSAFESFDDPEIGCVLLRNVSFFSPRDALRAPADFSPATQRGKLYDLDNLDTGHAIVEAITRYLDPGANVFDLEARRLAQEKTRGEARLIVQRVGQSAFKALVADAYHHRCT